MVFELAGTYGPSLTVPPSPQVDGFEKDEVLKTSIVSDITMFSFHW